MEELITHTHDPLRELFGADAFYERLKDVVTLYRQKFNIPAPSERPDQTPGS
jgi:hypothetical protein